MDRPGEIVAVDWGTSHLRLRLLSGPPSRGGAAAETSCADGIASVPAGAHERVFLQRLSELLDAAGRGRSFLEGGVVLFAGMITSTLGWFPTPYARVPAGAGELWAGRRTERLGGLQLHFLPGLRTEDDVLRGEEVEAVGILGAAGDGREGAGAGETSGETVLVLPGTHSKWIRWEAGRITGFVTSPTGDLHAALHRATLLARTLPESPAPVDGGLVDSFDRGVDLARRDGPLASLFKARSLPVLDGLSPPEASALLSGILIGGEVLERARRPIEANVGGSPRLRDLYLRAFARLGLPARGVPPELSERASAEGLWRLWASGGERPV